MEDMEGRTLREGDKVIILRKIYGRTGIDTAWMEKAYYAKETACYAFYSDRADFKTLYRIGKNPEQCYLIEGRKR